MALVPTEAVGAKTLALITDTTVDARWITDHVVTVFSFFSHCVRLLTCTDAVVAVTTAQAVVLTCLFAAVGGVPPLVARANTFHTSAIATTLIRAGQNRTRDAFESEFAQAKSSLHITLTMSRAIIRTGQFGAVRSTPPRRTQTVASLVVTHAVIATGIGATDEGTVCTHVAVVTFTLSFQGTDAVATAIVYTRNDRTIVTTVVLLTLTRPILTRPMSGAICRTREFTAIIPFEFIRAIAGTLGTHAIAGAGIRTGSVTAVIAGKVGVALACPFDTVPIATAVTRAGLDTAIHPAKVIVAVTNAIHTLSLPTALITALNRGTIDAREGRRTLATSVVATSWPTPSRTEHRFT